MMNKTLWQKYAKQFADRSKRPLWRRLLDKLTCRNVDAGPKIGDRRPSTGQSAFGDERRIYIPHNRVGVWEYRPSGRFWVLVRIEHFGPIESSHPEEQ